MADLSTARSAAAEHAQERQIETDLRDPLHADKLAQYRATDAYKDAFKQVYDEVLSKGYVPGGAETAKKQRDDTAEYALDPSELREKETGVRDESISVFSRTGPRLDPVSWGERAAIKLAEQEAVEAAKQEALKRRKDADAP